VAMARDGASDNLIKIEEKDTNITPSRVISLGFIGFINTPP